ncbi:MAG: SdrD B-like domain-containing protein, partial [Verrucomicrobiota bacterium]
GTYLVEFDLTTIPAAATVTSPDQGGDDGTDSDADPVSGRIGPIALSAGEDNRTVDMGIVIAPAAIGNFVWYDWNQNGLQDGGIETGAGGVTVHLLNNLGFTNRTTATDGAGLYFFTNVPPGDYSIEFDLSTLPAGFQPTVQGPSGTSDPDDSDANGGTGATELTTLTANEVDLTWDMGLAATGCAVIIQSVEPTPCIPDGGNGTFNVVVTVTYVNAPGGDLDINGQLFTPAATNDTEQFVLTGLMPDGSTGLVLQAQFVNDTNCADTAVFDAPESCAPCNAGSGDLGGFVFRDFNNNGAQDPGEPGFDGNTIVVKAYNNANMLVGSSPLAIDGTFSITGLVFG